MTSKCTDGGLSCPSPSTLSSLSSFSPSSTGTARAFSWSAPTLIKVQITTGTRPKTTMSTEHASTLKAETAAATSLIAAPWPPSQTVVTVRVRTGHTYHNGRCLIMIQTVLTIMDGRWETVVTINNTVIIAMTTDPLHESSLKVSNCVPPSPVSSLAYTVLQEMVCGVVVPYWNCATKYKSHVSMCDKWGGERMGLTRPRGKGTFLLVPWHPMAHVSHSKIVNVYKMLNNVCSNFFNVNHAHQSNVCVQTCFQAF